MQSLLGRGNVPDMGAEYFLTGMFTAAPEEAFMDRDVNMKPTLIQLSLNQVETYFL